MQTDRPIVLSLAGFDPCAGAGVLADIKTFEQLGVQGMAILTAQTIQTEDAVIRVDWQAIDTVLQGIQVLMQRYRIPVVKIGIVKDFDFLKAIVGCLKSYNKDAVVIWDPVIESSSGFRFFPEGDIKKLAPLYGNIALVTPNYDEYSLLKPYIPSPCPAAFLIKGGHRKEHVGLDILHQGNSVAHFLPSNERMYPKHGSGCVLSSAIAAHVALGKTCEQACGEAKKYVEHFLNSCPALLGYHNDAK